MNSCWGYTSNSGNASQTMFTQAEVYVKDLMRLLWEQHVYWTRMAIISIAMDLPDVDPTTKRLIRNPADFEAAFKPFYGGDIAHQFASLVTEHLVLAAELVKAAKAGNNQAAAELEKKWYANADQIVNFLNQINPYWTIEHMRTMWYTHLALTKSEAVARLAKDYAKDIAVFDQIEQEALMMADDFALGLIRQFGL
jgi:hypothetical protein